MLFVRIDVFLIKNGHESSNFFMKIWRKWRKKSLFLTEGVFLSQIMGMRAVLLFCKLVNVLKCCKWEERYEKS